jgi:cation diffusion facilitator family transporter
MTSNRYWQAKKVTLVGAITSAFLGVIKLLGGILFHSYALIADGVHSFSDLTTDIMVLFASKYGSQDADVSHPYGHQRIETAATLLLALLLILAGVGIAIDALIESIKTIPTTPNWLALPLALLSIAMNEGLFHYSLRIGQQINSSLIIANAWHHRSDAAASLIVALSLIGSMAGFHYLDTIAAIIIGFLVIKMGLKYGLNSVTELIDTAVTPETLAKIKQLIIATDGVKKIHQLRSRLMGGDILIDVHILVSPYISVSEGHFIAQQVNYMLINEFDRVKDVIVHVDPENDNNNCPAIPLANRRILEDTLLIPWQKKYPIIRYWILHYLNGKIHIDLIHDGQQDDLSQLVKTMSVDLKDQLFIQTIRLFYENTIILGKNSL